MEFVILWNVAAAAAALFISYFHAVTRSDSRVFKSLGEERTRSLVVQ
jgi:hypothetical protein